MDNRETSGEPQAKRPRTTRSAISAALLGGRRPLLIAVALAVAILASSVVQPAPAEAATIFGADLGGGDLNVSDGDVLSGTFTNVGTFTIPAGVTVFVDPGTPLSITANAIIIDGTLDGSDAGSPGGAPVPIIPSCVPSGTVTGNAGSGPGGGGGGRFGCAVHGSGGGGGGYGGAGGVSGSAFGADPGPAAGGVTFGDATSHSVSLGSGGGSGSAYNQANLIGLSGAGGPGGAAISLFGTVDLDGAILADGADGALPIDQNGAGGGGGSGGGVLLDGTLLLNGLISATGGDGVTNNFAFFSSGGGGGGGRIKLFGQSVFEAGFSFDVGGGGFDLSNLSDGTEATAGEAGTFTDTLSIEKAPRLANLWLCNIPEAEGCDNKESGVEGVNLDVRLGGPIVTLDPKCVGFPNFLPPEECDTQQIGSFEFEIRYDAKYVKVDVEPGTIFTLGNCINGINGGGGGAGNQVCDPPDVDCNSFTGEGFIQFFCVTKGKPINASSGPGTLAVVHVRPTADVYKLLIANQENGIVTELINQDCQLSDLQGHPIKTDVCENAAITIRYLEGDVHADCVIDVLDQQQIAFRWGAQLGHLLYSARYDLEPSFPKADGDIDAKDLQFVYGRHVIDTSTCKNPHPAQDPVDPQVKVDLPVNEG